VISRAAMIEVIERYGACFGRPDGGRADVIAAEWQRQLGHFSLDILHRAIDRLVETRKDSPYRPHLPQIKATARDIMRELQAPTHYRQPGLPGVDFCRHCETAFLFRASVRLDGAEPRTHHERAYCDCGWRLQCRYRSDAELEAMRADDPIAEDVLRGRMQPKPPAPRSHLQLLTAGIGRGPERET
jgi:hypothetical protein